MRRLLLVSALIAGLGCSDPNALPNASVPNVVDTVTLWSLVGGPLRDPTAYSLADRRALRTYESIGFEFAFTIDAAQRPVLLPLAVLGLSPGSGLKPGLLSSAVAFDQMLKAPRNGYLTADTIPIQVGDLYFVRSRPICTSLGGVPEYGKMEVLALDPAQQTVTFQVLANNNCGYRALGLGIPKS
jgi:hypothetical protein